MRKEPGLDAAAELFKVLSNGSRLWLLRLIREDAKSVAALVEETGMSQPLVSQHLGLLKRAGLVTAERRGREVFHHLADHHVAHVIDDAVIHAQEDHR